MDTTPDFGAVFPKSVAFFLLFFHKKEEEIDKVVKQKKVKDKKNKTKNENIYNQKPKSQLLQMMISEQRKNMLNIIFS